MQRGTILSRMAGPPKVRAQAGNLLSICRYSRHQLWQTTRSLWRFRQRKNSHRRPKFEFLESRDLLSVSPLSDTFLPISSFAEAHGSSRSAAIAFSYSGFENTVTGSSARLRVAFQAEPQVHPLGPGAFISLDGADLWLDTGAPVLPVASVTLALPKGMQLQSVEPILLGQGQVIAQGIPPVVAPSPVPFDYLYTAEMDWNRVLDRSLTSSEVVHYSNYLNGGFRLAVISVVPVLYDHESQNLLFYHELEFNLTLTPASEELPVNPRIMGEVASAVVNPETLQTYASSGASQSLGEELFEYVIVTSTELAGEFEPLIHEKISRGITARIVTTDWIAANYPGMENGDLADRIRHFLRDAYFNHGTRWVLLGGDAEIIPARGVYAAVGNIVETRLATDMYYACLDGPWNGDGDELWGEKNDGLNGIDIDLLPELFVGRAPVSNPLEARNFAAKTLLYETTPHPNANTALLLGEKLDSITQGSISNEIISQQAIPFDWNIQTLYDSDSFTWSTTQVMASLNASPNIVHHLGHANSAYVARMTLPQVESLRNNFPYFMYSQGCDAGSFDTRDIAIGEQHVISSHGAVAVVMNSRYGWYVPGNAPGGSHDYALEFFDAVFNEQKVRLGEALVDSKLDNLFRLNAGGAYRWIHLTSTLLGDPELALQTPQWVPPQRSSITGIVFQDVNGNTLRDVGEQALSDYLVYLDFDQDGQWDHGSATFTQSTPISLRDFGTTLSQLEVTGVGMIHQLSVTLNISHTYDADLRITLISPSGKRVTLVANSGGSGDNFLDTTFDDAASGPIAQGTPPFTGTFRPLEPLGSLKGENADGTWTLEIVDTMPWDVGVLRNWSLTFTYEEPHTLTDAEGVYAFRGLAPGSYVIRAQGNQTTTGETGQGAGIRVSLAPGQQLTNADLAIPVGRPTPVELGQITTQVITGVGDHQQLYRLKATFGGILTLTIDGQPADVPVRAELYDANWQPLARKSLAHSDARFDWDVEAGSEYYLAIGGLQGQGWLVNLLEITTEGVIIHDTPENDRIAISLRDTLSVSLNEVEYDLDTSLSSSNTAFRIIVNSQGGEDSLALLLSDSDWYFAGGPDSLRTRDSQTTVEATNVELVRVVGGAGSNMAELTDSPGDDAFFCRPGFARLSGPGFQIMIENFAAVHAYSRAGGSDVAELSDSAGDDRFIARPQYSLMTGPGYYHRVKGFRYVHGYSRNGGQDEAQLFGAPGSDTLTATPDWVTLAGDTYLARAKFFRTVQVFGNGGRDSGRFFGSPQQDQLFAGPRWVEFHTGDTTIAARGITQCWVDGKDGWDIAEIVDSPGDDWLRAWPGKTFFTGPGFNLQLSGFEDVTARSANGGADVAELWDSNGDDRFVSFPLLAVMEGERFRHTVSGFPYVHGYSVAGGYDTAFLFGEDSITAWTIRPVQTLGVSESSVRRAKAFDAVFIQGGLSGQDHARIFDSPEDDQLDVAENQVTFFTGGTQVTLRDVPSVKAYATTGKNVFRQRESDLALSLIGTWL